ncbi:MAG: hypothetical protein EAY75_08985 [Bacteroidetes bacterium]|nr:MAG: hypothetical protein EAY75_08985 [Bacteroidota bacterium]
MKKLLLLSFIIASVAACKDGQKDTNATPAATQVSEVQSDKAGVQGGADTTAITDVVHSFYKWYDALLNDEKRAIDFIDVKGKYAKVDTARFAMYSAEMMKSGFISQAFIDNEVVFLKGLEVEWKKNNEDGSEMLTGLDMDTNFCGQDWDIKMYTTGAIKIDALAADKAKATVEGSKIELVKESGKWLISKISCE